MLFIIVAVYAAYLYFDFRPVAMSKKQNVILPCVIFFGIGFVVQLLFELKVNVPSPAVPISAAVSSLINLK